MCFECTLLFKLFIRFIHLLYVWVFWLHVYLFAMWVLGAKGDQKRALWMVVNQHGREGIGVGPASVCIIGKLLSTFHQNRKHKEKRLLPLSLLSPFSVCVSNKIPSVGCCLQHAWYVFFPLSTISGNTLSCTPQHDDAFPVS